MKKIPKVALLYILNWVLFVVFFSFNIFDALIFKTVSVSISKLPIADGISTILLTLWMIVPQTLILTAANKMYLQLPAKKFIITQIFFAVSVVLVLYAVLMSAKSV